MGQSKMSKHERLIKAREAAGLSTYKLADLVRTSQAQISRLERGERKLTKEWAERLSGPLGVSAQDLMFGVETGDGDSFTQTKSVNAIKLVRVIGKVSAGRWMDRADLIDPDEQIQIPVVPGRFESVDQFAFKVEGPSMNARNILPGDYVVCVPYWLVRTAPTDGDVVVIERQRGDLVERTVKELVVHADRFEFWPRSTDIRYQKPEIVERSESGMVEDDNTTITIVGKVLSRFGYI